MSQLASRVIPSTVGSNSTEGNNARALSLADLHPAGAPQPAREPRPRTPLSLVVSIPRRNRTPIVVSLFLLVVGALAAVLVMSVSVSQGQYELVALTNQQTALQKSNQALELGLSAQEAPQSLVARAAGMGMVPAGATGQIDVRTKKVTGNPQPATADTKGLVALPPADINKPPAGQAAADTQAKDAAVPAQDGRAVADAEKTQTKAQTKVRAKTQAGSAGAAPAAVTPDLNGGTIPAPAQKDS
ncbi:hypothetical protein CVV68_11715 [Arthrobacter livingstonensis]|uniref:Cell division protein FtsL n=1 Tax=Arthrobacter livingstonensis TaxID=670078 RepID=A0A2V5LBC3_9MICC|nr:hypothetical protein [Arthrobacter livingstonensis]PYI67073.1 hypothetical protein CVV68_11715 [Arthrobacter livingstonensis]